VSASSLPGNPLYPVKRLSEKIHYMLTFSDERKVELHIIFADKRTKEFTHTFKQKERINSELLNAMLDEIELAMVCTNRLPKERAAILIEKLVQCNEHQLEVLQNTKVHACACDGETIDDAINICTKRHQCIQCEMNPDACDDPNCPCKG
jgi:hypothetical protein